MKLLLAIAILLLCLLLAIRLYNSHQSTTTKAPGLSNGQLLACPDSPNCINSEYPQQQAHYLAPLTFPKHKSHSLMNLARSTLLEMGADISIENEQYLAATFSSTVFKFVDDIELRLDKSTQTLHFRSASRTGYSDLGVNKQRMQHFSQLINKKINSQDE